METPKLLTDDMDIRDTELSMYHGNNGDYYICLKETKRGEIVKLDTRIAMSGGNATPEIRQAVSVLFKALLGEKVDTSESCLHLQNVSGCALPKYDCDDCSNYPCQTEPDSHGSRQRKIEYSKCGDHSKRSD